MSDPKSQFNAPKSYTNHVTAQIRHGKPGDVEKLLNEAFKRYPDAFFMHHFIGKFCTLAYNPKKGINYDKHAEYALEKAHEIDPGDAINLMECGRFLKRQGDFENAERAYIKAITEEGFNKMNLTALGDVYYQQKKYDDALGCFYCAAKLDPRDAKAKGRMLEIAVERPDLSADDAWNIVKEHIRAVSKTSPKPKQNLDTDHGNRR